MFWTFNLSFDILAAVLATFPTIGQIFTQFSGHSAQSTLMSEDTKKGFQGLKLFFWQIQFTQNKLKCYILSLSFSHKNGVSRIIDKYFIESRVSSETTGWSADVYCQIINNQKHGQSSYSYQNGKKGKKASYRRYRERVCVRDRESLKMEVTSVVKMAIGETDYLGII
jgi:hypothetical protein